MLEHALPSASTLLKVGQATKRMTRAASSGNELDFTQQSRQKHMEPFLFVRGVFSLQAMLGIFCHMGSVLIQ